MLSCECDRVDDRKRGIIEFGNVRYQFYPLCENNDSRDSTAVSESNVSEPASAEETETAEDNGNVDTVFKDNIKEILGWHYRYEPLTVIPAKFTATELAESRHSSPKMKQKNSAESAAATHIISLWSIYRLIRQ